MLRIAGFRRASAEQTIAEMATAVLRDAPFPRFALAGLSMGGYVCMEIMRRAPERVSRLALLDTRATADSPEETQRRLSLIELAKSEQDLAPIMRQMIPLLLHSAHAEDPILADLLLGMAERTGVDAFIKQQRAIISRPDSRRDLTHIGVPTLILCGRQDSLTPLAYHDEMASLIAESEQVVIEDSGHIPPLEQPAEVNRALRAWLGRPVMR